MNSCGPLVMVLGIRPDVIRAAIIIKELDRALGDQFVFVWSGQHYSDNLKDVFFRQLGVRAPDIDWRLGESSDSKFIAEAIKSADDTFCSLNPAAVVFLGDTNTVMASIAAAAKNIPIVHIEGCMRSYDWRMPEEKYRTTIDHLSDLIYAYLDDYKAQGLIEGLNENIIEVTGNPIVDVLQQYFSSGQIRMAPEEKTSFLKGIGVSGGQFSLLTCHRRENVESTVALERILYLAGSAQESVVFPAGYRTQREILNRGIEIPGNVFLIDPVGYREFLELLISSSAVFTDSGTVVEEAAILGVPSVQMRSSTERPQVYECGASVRFNPHADSDQEAVGRVLSELRRLTPTWTQPFGDGYASKRISEDLVRRFHEGAFSRIGLTLSTKPIDRAYQG